jgi:F-type H+-transporting ATPase subunit b
LGDAGEIDVSGFASAFKEMQVRRLLGAGFVRALAGLLVWGMTTVALPVATMPVVTAVAADEEAHGHGDHVEIGHNPPQGVAKKDFESPAEFRSDLAIWSLAVFLLLLGLLGKFAWKPIMEGLDKREQGIEHQIAETKAANEEAKRMLVSYERRLAEASDEVRGMLEEARRDSEATKQAIVAEARKAAEDEQARAKHEIGLARDEALSSIALKAGDLAVEVAGKFLREKIGKEDHSRLVRDSVASLGTKPSVN